MCKCCDKMEESSICCSALETNDIGELSNEDKIFEAKEGSSLARSRICLIGDLQNDEKCIEAARAFDVPVLFSETGREFLNDGSCDTIFVTNAFGGPVFDAIHQSEQRIVGPTVLQACAEKNKDLPRNVRPQYCQAMMGLNICFTGFRKREDLNLLVQLIHFMGGSIRKDMGSKVTHLVANSRMGDKYQYAATFRVPIMSEAWVHACWEQRDIVDMVATNAEMMKYKHKPFFNASVCFFGFPGDEHQHMTEVLIENGGAAVELEDETCSHVVVKDTEMSNFLKTRVTVPKFQKQGFLTPETYTSTPRSSRYPTLKFISSSDFETPAKYSRLSLSNIEEEIAPEPGPEHGVSSVLSRYPHSLSYGTSIAEEDYSHLPLVVDESAVQNVPEKVSPKAFVVKVEWFWSSVQNEACVCEKDYLFEDYLEELITPNGKQGGGQHSASPSSRARKRKRNRDGVRPLNESPSIHKRRSSVSDAALLSMSGSFLDCSASSEKTASDTLDIEAAITTPQKGASPRQQVFLELVQTEQNYVGILKTIVTLFKEHLEELPERDALLNNTELKIIFGNLPPIYEVHCKMLLELRETALHWKEEACVGNIILKYVPDLTKAYPSFVNYFENIREMLVKCDQTNQRFHAFLKICQTRPECGRQSLQELLIRPVQRLPSVILLLADLLKHTSKSLSDHAALEKALAAVREVLTYINEDKRRTEGQLVIFDIFNEIENCPPHLVSSHRSFIARCDIIELSDGLSGRGDYLIFFLFSDTMEVCKKRSKAFKSPNVTGSLHSVKITKPYKHIRLLPLSTIRKVIDIQETNDCRNAFCLRCRSNQELCERQYSFALADEETDKNTFLRTLCRQIANTVCRTDTESFLSTSDSHALDLDTSDVVYGSLSKAFKRTKQKVGRAFSFNKTPSKLKRAVSTMMSPLGSTSNLTPASQLAQMRLASCNNLNELGSSPVKSETYVAPMSVQPTRKNKAPPINVASLRRL